MVLDWRDRVFEIALVPGVRRPLLTFDGVAINVLPGKTMLGRDKVGTDALRHEIGFVSNGRVSMHCTGI